jgi:Tfp pilus assembly protein FimT
MYIRKLNKGFTLVEVLGVSALAGTMIYLSSSLISNSYREMKFNDYAAKIDYFSKYAKINSIKSSTYTALCIKDNVLTIQNLGSASSSTCQFLDKKNTIKTLDLSMDKGVKIISKLANGSDTPTSVMYDGRGLATSSSLNKTLCITNGNKYVKYEYQMVNTVKESKTVSTPGNMVCN